VQEGSKQSVVSLYKLTTCKSGRLDLNQRPLRPERSALARLSYAPHAGPKPLFYCPPRPRQRPRVLPRLRVDRFWATAMARAATASRASTSMLAAIRRTMVNLLRRP
jgi:hypothetical protein